ncbi:MAG: NAD(P)H-dependent oxidoreductase [Pseudomonadota bacterium]
MATVLLYYIHPGHQHSHTNLQMQRAIGAVDGIGRVDLYSEYPRFNINIDREQQRLVDHDFIVLQFPVFWYSGPSLLKEWIDLVLEYGFAYGSEGNALKGKKLMLAVTAGGPEQAYSSDGYQNHKLRTFLTPFQQTATLCKMEFVCPYVLYNSLHTEDTQRIEQHANGFVQLIEAIRDDRFNLAAASAMDTISVNELDQLTGEGA